MPTRTPRDPKTSHYGKPGSTVTGEQRAQIIAWIREGLPRNEIARRAGRSGSTISGIAKAEGLEFGGRTQVAAATEARTVDNRSRRTELQAALLDDVDRLRQKFWQPYVWVGNSKDGPERITLEEPDAAALKSYVQAAATLLGRHMDLDRHDADQAADDAKSLLANIGRALGVTGPAA